MSAKLWRSRRDRTRSIHGCLSVWCWRVGFHAHLHTYATGNPRLVVQPFVVVDL